MRDDVRREAAVRILICPEENYPDLVKVHSWVKTITYHCFIEYYRKAKKNRVDTDTIPEKTYQLDLERKNFRVHVCSQIEKLSSGYRECFTLHIDGYSHIEISKIMGISVGTVKSQISRAGAILRQHFWKEKMTL